MSDKSGASVGPPTTVEAQDPLPESNWFWRRAFVFLLSAGLLVLVYWRIDALADAARAGNVIALKGMVSLLRGCLVLIGGLILFYMLAPSAEQLVKLIQTASALKQGVAFRSTVSATQADGSRAVARSEATTEPQGAGNGAAAAPAPDGTGLPDYDRTNLPWKKDE